MSNSNSRDEWDAMAEVTRCPVPTPAEHDEHTALRDAVAAERAAVVAFVHARIGMYDGELRSDEAVVRALQYLADEIERGEHRREGDK
jgi:hypothetical protein